MNRLRSSLWNNPDFLRFWTADIISQVGSRVTQLAVPLIAALTLDASPFEVGLLAAVNQAPALLFGLFVGAWLDRRARRPVMIFSDLSRAALTMTIPIAYALDSLSMGLLIVISFLLGIFNLCADIAYMSYLPALVSKEDLLDANSKIEATYSAATVIGPGLAGGLISLITAPYAMIVDAISFLGSAFALSRIETPESHPGLDVDHPPLMDSIREGLSVVRSDDILRAMLGCSAINTFFGNIFLAVYTLFLLDSLGMSSTTIGLVFAVGGVGAFIGALLTGPLSRRLGVGWTMIAGVTIFGIFGLLIPLAVLAPSLSYPLVFASEFLQWLGIVIYFVTAVGVRQSRVEDSVLGRVNSTFIFIVRGSMPIGSLVGGILGSAIGLPATLVVGELGIFVALAFLLHSPIRFQREIGVSSETRSDSIVVTPLEQVVAEHMI